MDTRLIRTPALYLVGFMGSGKTTIGSALADELGWSFFDLDEDIEAAAGARIADIDRKSTRLNSSHLRLSRMPSSA